MNQTSTTELPDTTPSESEPSVAAPQATPTDPGSPMAAATPATPAGTHARSEAQAIAEICLIAGCPDRTAEFLASSVSEAQVRRALLEARAQQSEISSHITADVGTTAHPAVSPVIAAVRKLISKE